MGAWLGGEGWGGVLCGAVGTGRLRPPRELRARGLAELQYECLLRRKTKCICRCFYVRAQVSPPRRSATLQRHTLTMAPTPHPRHPLTRQDRLAALHLLVHLLSLSREYN